MKEKDGHFLPLTREEAVRLGWRELDVILVSADAYADHPAFGAALIGRYLESLGLAVGIIPQPDWRSTGDFTRLGRPKLFFGVTAGNLDSMVSLYTAQRKIRSDDPYSENGRPGKRPYLPSLVYTNRLKEAFPGIPVILGGIEASLRRIAHYDYYTDTVRPSLLLDAKADLLVYGNAEKPLSELVMRLKKGERIEEIKDIRGTVIPVKQKEKQKACFGQLLPSYEEVKKEKERFRDMTRLLAENLNPYQAKVLYQETGTQAVLVNPPSLPLTSEELDVIYELPFTRKAHPVYKKGIPGLKVVENSIAAHRGCYGGCNFCSLFLHQGKTIQSRSISSIQKEVRSLRKQGHSIVITDIGGPTANMYGTFCRDKEKQKSCTRRSCLYPRICSSLNVSSGKYRELLKTIRDMEGVKAVFINSGIRYDLALLNPDFMDELVQYHTPGQLSIAPEHSVASVLQVMGKPLINLYDEFSRIFYNKCKKANKKQYLIPYFITGHPGADEGTEEELGQYLQKNRIRVEQIQEFYPTPMSLSTAIYHTGLDVFSARRINSEKKLSMKKHWKALLIKK
ncbi:MAG: YgiQ family radical SAM protein [bacterium]|nr:YgiQ family radical SAM protein [bacterium]